MKRHLTYPAQAFIDDPSLYLLVEGAWRAKDWKTLLGVTAADYPVGAVLATVEEGVTFHWQVLPPPVGEGK